MLNKNRHQAAHAALPKETPAFFCANSNKVSVNAESPCEPRQMPRP